jgi:hypothetical protein
LGYVQQALRFDIIVSAPSAHEQIGAKMELMKLAPMFGKQAINNILNIGDA